MRNRFFTSVFAIFVLILFTSYSFSQDKTKTVKDPTNVSKEDTTAKDQDGVSKDDVKKEEPAKLPMQNAKTYFDGYTNFINSLVLFKLSSKDNVLEDKLYYKVDKGEFALYSTPFAIKEEGTHTITYFSVDKMGNKENNYKVLKIITDVTPPSVVVTTTAPLIKEKIYASENLTFSITATDELSGLNKIEYSTDGQNFNVYSKPFSISATENVDLKVRVTDNVDNAAEKYAFKAVDESGKAHEMSVSALKIYVDKKIPVVQIKPEGNFFEKNGKNIASIYNKYIVTATDEDSGVAEIYVRIDGKGEFQLYKKEVEFSKNGEHMIEAKAKDKTGNESEIVTYSVFVDIIPPVSNIKMITEK